MRNTKYSNGMVAALAAAMLFACLSIGFAIVTTGTKGMGLDRNTLEFTVTPATPRVERCPSVQVTQGMTLSGAILTLRDQEPDILNSSEAEAVKAYAEAEGLDPAAALPTPALLRICVSPDGKQIVSINGVPNK